MQELLSEISGPASKAQQVTGGQGVHVRDVFLSFMQ